nr:tetratricopeptide repeat protein [Oscillospiraceae bacterium]
MTTIFHLSDLHIVTSGHWNTLRDCILAQARELRGERVLLVVTGDFHNYYEAGYRKASEFLKTLITELGIQADEDVFLIPGNHDVGGEQAICAHFSSDKSFDWEDWDFNQETARAKLKDCETDDRHYAKLLERRLNAYAPYCAFARELGVYPEDCGLLPARVHVRCWEKGKLNILHLNTTLIYDGHEKEDQKLDTQAASGDEIWEGFDPNLPTLALGHNSYYDLCEAHQLSLSGVFRRRGVCAYLCGDTHRAEREAARQMIPLSYGYSTETPPIPNVVGVKGAANESDTYSDFGLYLHRWDEQRGEVRSELLSWKPDRNQTSFTHLSEEGCYYIPRMDIPLLLEEQRKQQEELARLRDAAQKKEGPPPPDTDLLRKARTLFDAGRADEALQLLSAPAREEELEAGEAATRRGQERIRQYIQEELLKIEIWKRKGLNRETVPLIRAAYRHCAELIRKHRVSVHVLYDYVIFLSDIHAHAEAIDTAQWLLAHSRQEREPEETLARLNNTWGNLLRDTNRLPEAEERYREALAIYRRLAEANPAAYEPDLAGSCNNLGNLLSATNRLPEAEERHREALAIYRRLAEANPAAYEPDLAGSCNNLGNLLRDTNRLPEAEERYREALAIYRRLAEANPEAYEPDLAGSCNNLGNLLRATNRLPEAEERYREALAIRRRLAEANPAAYEPALAMSCNNLGLLLRDTDRKPEAEKLYRE